MKFLLDHDVPDEVERLLRHWQHDVQRLREILPVTSTDHVIFELSGGNSESSSVAIGTTF